MLLLEFPRARALEPVATLKLVSPEAEALAPSAVFRLGVPLALLPAPIAVLTLLPDTVRDVILLLAGERKLMAVLKLPIPLESASTPQAVLLAPAAVALAPVCASAPVALPPQTNCACAGGALEPNAMRKHAARSA